MRSSTARTGTRSRRNGSTPARGRTTRSMRMMLCEDCQAPIDNELNLGRCSQCYHMLMLEMEELFVMVKLPEMMEVYEAGYYGA